MTCKTCNDTGIDPIFGASRCWHCPKAEVPSEYNRFKLDITSDVTHVEICPKMQIYISRIGVYQDSYFHWLFVKFIHPGERTHGACRSKWDHAPNSTEMADFIDKLYWKHGSQELHPVSHRVENKVLILTELS